MTTMTATKTASPALYIANLGKYNEGRIDGQWFTFPIDMDEVAQVIGLNDYYEEIIILDHENCPFKVWEYGNIEEYNRLAELFEGMDEDELKAVKLAEEYGYFRSAEEAIDGMKDGVFVFYHDCFDMKDVAWEVVSESGKLDGIPKDIAQFFDYEAYGRHLDIVGNFHYLGLGVYVEIAI